MATDGERENEAQRRRRLVLLNEIVALSAAARELCLLSIADTSTLLGIAPRTLYRARQRRVAMKAAGSRIDPASLPSLPFLEPAEGEAQFQYLASELLEYQQRRIKARQDAVMDEGASSPSQAMRGFQTWLASAGPAADESWPFSIQPGGRPIDLYEAIATGKLTGKSKRLGMRQFCERLADAASEQAASSEREALNAAPARGADPGVNTPSRRRSRRTL